MTYTYDIENRLVARSASTGNAALRYDPLGRLYEVTPSTGSGGSGSSGTTRFLYDGDALVAEYDAAGAMTRRYVHNVGADVPLLSYAGSGLAQPSYLHADHQGSIVALSNASGIATINSYDEYGIPGASNTGRFQYTGQIWLAELGMYHYKARVYSPTLGRFLQTDPIGYDDQYNLYAYVGNDPVNASDPSGTVICNTNTNAQCAEVHKAAGQARAAVLQASSDLRDIAGAMSNGTELTAAQQGMVGAFERRFGAGSATASNLSAAARHFDRVANRIGEPGHGLNVHFRTAQQMGNAIASAQGNSLRIGPRFLGAASERGGMSPAFVIMHEGGHEAGKADQILPSNAPIGIGRTALGHRRAYGVKATDWLGIHAPGIAARNNDSYNCFVMPACGGP
jgi:RHS repeat-associated protein